MAAGDLILLAGEMGAGKTAFAQGFGAGLGVTDPVFDVARELAGLPWSAIHLGKLKILAKRPGLV